MIFDQTTHYRTVLLHVDAQSIHIYINFMLRVFCEQFLKAFTTKYSFPEELNLLTSLVWGTIHVIQYNHKNCMLLHIHIILAEKS